MKLVGFLSREMCRQGDIPLHLVTEREVSAVERSEKALRVSHASIEREGKGDTPSIGRSGGVFRPRQEKFERQGEG
jgi:hypothetical protein